MATWPGTLPRPLANGYGLEPVDPCVRTDFEVGAGRSRRRTAARNDRVQVVWDFTDAEMEIFRSWFDDASTGAGGGSVWFNVDLMVGTGGVDTVEARFTGIYKAPMQSGSRWRVSATLEIR